MLTKKEKEFIKNKAEFGISEGSLDMSEDFERLYTILDKIEVEQ